MTPTSGPAFCEAKGWASKGWPIDFVIGLLAAWLCLFPDPAIAADPQILFVCGSGPEAAPTSMLKLTGILQDNGNWTDLQFSGFGKGLAPMLFPPQPGSGKENFFFSNSEGPDGYVVHVRFTVAGASYRLYSRQTPPAEEDDMGGGEAGLDITASDGATRRIVCDEKPYLFIGYIHDAVACDLENPLGKSACDYRKVPQRAVSDVAPTQRP